MLAVAFNSRPSTGKSTVARYLAANHGFHVAAVGDVLRRALTGMGFDLASFTDTELKELPRAEMHGLSPRGMMLSLGEWGRSIHPQFWLYRVMALVPADAAGVIFEDVGSEMEAAFARDFLGAPLIRFTRDGVEDRFDGRAVLDPDHTVPNDGSVEEAAAAVLAILRG